MGSLPDGPTKAYEKKIIDMIKELDVFCYENDELRSKYINACSSYHQAIPQLLIKFLHSDEFNQEMTKVRNVLIEQGSELGRRKSGDLSLSMASGENRIEFDPAMLEKVEKPWPR
ncbi:hypothetical protein Tco_1150572 [Tanacetum coccineum]